MPLTRSFTELVQRCGAADPAFAEALLREGVDTMLAGDIDTGKAILQVTAGRIGSRSPRYSRTSMVLSGTGKLVCGSVKWPRPS